MANSLSKSRPGTHPETKCQVPSVLNIKSIEQRIAHKGLRQKTLIHRKS